MTTTTDQQYVFFRQNFFSPIGETPTRLSEREARMLLGAAGINAERAIAKLKSGKEVRTRFGTYTARQV